MSKVLAIPLEEIREHLAQNVRQDVKVVAPELLGPELCAKLQALGRTLKPEQPLEGVMWRHSDPAVANSLCESREFEAGPANEASGPFAVCFANDKGPQDSHYHARHVEIYYSEFPLGADYRRDENSPVEHVQLEKGGVLIFAAGVVHRARLGGLTVVTEIPAVKDDKVLARLAGCEETLPHDAVSNEARNFALKTEVVRDSSPPPAPRNATPQKFPRSMIGEAEDAAATEIIAMERAALDRWGKGDPDGFLEISDPEVTYFDPFLERRLDGLAGLRSLYSQLRGKIRIDQSEIINPRVQFCGDGALLTYNFVSSGSEGEARWNCTEVYRRREGQWRIIHSHWSFTRTPLSPMNL